MRGIVKKLNTSTSEFYPGSRYPIYVIISHDKRVEYNAKGHMFEHILDQLVVIG